MKNSMTMVVMIAALLGTGAVAGAQEGEGSGEVTGEASASGEVSPTGDTRTPVAAELSSGEGAPKGQLGVGAALILSGVGGLEVTYHLNEKMMLNGMLLFVSISPDMGPSTTLFGLGGSFFYNLFDKGMADLFIGGRLAYTSNKQSQDLGGMTVSSTKSDFDIEVPLRIQLQLHRRLAVHFESGIAMQLSSEDMGNITANQTTIVVGATNLFATGGFTIYF